MFWLRSLGALAVWVPLVVLLCVPSIDLSCDRLFKVEGDVTNGSFQSPIRSGLKPYKINVDQEGNLTISTTVTKSGNNSIFCMYKFVAEEDERVLISFIKFNLRGEEPECSKEYMDIYLDLQQQDDPKSLINQPSSRFCSSMLPRRSVSVHNTLALVFYSEFDPPVDKGPIFAGRYEFIRPKFRDQIGPPLRGTSCSHLIRSSDTREGEFQSLTYPGIYTKGLKCSYKFLGSSGQRIRLEFLDLDVYSGGPHCPLDSVKIYDGAEETDPIISNICGSHKSLILFSTRENLLVTFTTLQREMEVQNRGFSAYFEFSDKFVDTSFIRGPNVRHVRGSECDQRIISRRETRGHVVAPEPSHHSNAICRYTFEGLQTSNDYEKVQLKFVEFDLRTSRSVQQAAGTLGSHGSNSSSIANNDANFSSSTTTSSEICPDNYLRVYTSEQKPDQRQDPNDYDYVFCGAELPQSVESDASSLLIEYNSGSLGGSFKIEYVFIVDFRIPGTQIPPGCDYVYRAESLKSGTIHSPRHPAWYMNDINCSYTFYTKVDEILLLQFGTFRMSSPTEKLLGYNEVCTGEDHVEITELTSDSTEQKATDQTEIGTYCGTTAPGPILSHHPLRVVFRTNKQQVNYGFCATYNFHHRVDLKSNEFVTNCGGQIFASQRFKTGTFHSPPTYRAETYEKRNHICSWNITARPTHRIAIDFSKFELEGSPSVRGCVAASVRIDTGKSRQPKEICGTLEAANSSAHQFVSDDEWLTLTFISTKQASGSTGFTATWTEIKRL